MFIYTLCLYTRAHTHEYAYLSIHSNAIILSSTTHFHILRSCPARVIYYYVVCTHINNTLQRLREILRQSSVNVYSGSCATFVAATRLTDRPTDRPALCCNTRLYERHDMTSQPIYRGWITTTISPHHRVFS